MHESEKIINENGSICVQNNKIIVKNPIGNGNFPIIIPPSKGHLYIDGEIISRPFKVKEENKIEFEQLTLPFKRSIEIITSKSAIEAYASVEYEGGKSYSLKDREENYSLALEVIEKEGEVPPNITKEEFLEQYEIIKNPKYNLDVEQSNYYRVRIHNMDEDDWEHKFEFNKDYVYEIKFVKENKKIIEYLKKQYEHDFTEKQENKETVLEETIPLE